MIYYIVFGLIFGFCLVINLVIKGRMNKYFDVKTNISGFEVIKKYLKGTKMEDVYVVTTKESVSNYYDIGNKAIKLSEFTFNEEDVVNNSLAILVASDTISDNKFIRLWNKFYKYFNYIIRLCYLLIILCFLIKEVQFCYASIVVYTVLFVLSLIYFICVNKEASNIKEKCNKLELNKEMEEVIDVLKYRSFSLFIETLFMF